MVDGTREGGWDGVERAYVGTRQRQVERQVRRMIAALAVVAMLAGAGPAHIDYTVQPGDTLEHIARRHGTTVSQVAGENGISDPDRIVAGDTLSLADGPGSTGATQGGDGTAHHVVAPGETLSGIAQRYGVTVRQLAEWNGLASAHRVLAGARISVSGPAAHDVADAGGGGTHRVAPGETLSHIALRSGVSVAQIARANQIADPNRIVAGAVLTIPGGWHCPVRGGVLFVNDFGITKPDGRFHDGVDLYAPTGTPVVAPVAGHVEHVTGERAGLQFRLHGMDGHVYVGAHLDSFGALGWVRAGEVIGTVGTSGNAQGSSSHLHFEIHANDQPVNPYPSLLKACG